ncbi:MAG: flagellar basal body-associated FliL family protein [Proteobacteria bacterium]|jgi:flagellar FliL protein|nr:flagellar basal body-associated FliL family protein [Pseudomonadota bacterium]
MAEPNQAPTEKKPLNVKLILGIAFAVVNLGILSGGTLLVYKATLGHEAPSIRESELVKAKKAREEALDAELAKLGPLIYTMDKFTVNLNGEPKRTVRLEVNLEMLGKDGFEELISTENRAKARDRIVRILNEKSFAEVESIQGKLFLKDRISGEINALLKDGVVKDVYFSEFVVQ